MTPRNFNAAELDEMQVDWQRTHNVKMVAELHGCTKRDVAEALGLSPCRNQDRQVVLGGALPGRGCHILRTGGRRHEHHQSRRKIWHQLVDRLDRLQENERNDPYEQTRNCAGADLPG